MDEVAPGEIPAELEREERAAGDVMHLGRARASEVPGERPLALEIDDADLVSAARLPLHLLQHVHLRAADVEGREDVKDLHRAAASRASSYTASRLRVRRPDRERRVEALAARAALVRAAPGAGEERALHRVRRVDARRACEEPGPLVLDEVPGAVHGRRDDRAGRAIASSTT